ncbi:proteasome assembly chaperone family protein [Tessaracoccus flavus]|uniref:Proteasome protein n=1 Tax=Tessaracoccus flavus TaxID=1610493 RepID=A0A1Q2CET5_9ACTN|nr:PAC2 family protein [Tessaracoccus flavus]AQP44616.1 proteasome protein [Tessaracoccus flavus]SDZ08307.1 PAC2 family protein [Tessaracoccus flavus]
MQNPSDLYRFVTDPEPAPQGNVLLVALGSFIDAGQVQRLLSGHLLETGDAELIATFDIDQLYDYRGRRPTMTFDSNRWAEYDAPSMLLHRLTDRDGETYHLLTGAEPDFQWERVVEAIRELVETLRVALVVTVHGVPMGVPHTRPVGFTAHSTDPSLIGDAHSPFGRVQVPGSIAALLELRLGQLGHRAAGFAIHVPHYLAASEFAEGALTALNAVVDLTRLSLPNDDLVEKAEINRRAIAAEVEGNEEVVAIVSALEQQYDAFMQGQHLPSLWAEGAKLPSADQLGAELEDFLRTVSDEDPDQDG